MNEVSADPNEQQASSGLRDSKGFTMDKFGVHVIPGAILATAGEFHPDLADQVGVTSQHARDVLHNGNARLDSADDSDSFVDE